MGLIKFIVPEHERFNERALGTIFLMGIENIPWPCKLIKENDFHVVERNNSESGRLLMSLDIKGFGELVVSTATLPERDEPYNLLLELVRGTVNRLSNQLFDWTEGGLELSPDFVAEYQQLIDRLAELVFTQTSDSDNFIDDCLALLDESVSKSFELGQKFSDFVLDLRIKHDGQIKTVVGVTCTDQRNEILQLPEWATCALVSPFDSIEESDAEAIDWKSIQQNLSLVREKTKFACCGPVLDFSKKRMPAWLDSKKDFDVRRKIASKFARCTAANIIQQGQLIYVARGLNGVSQHTISYPQQVQITVDMLEAIETVRSDIATMVSFDQPWGERLAWSVGGTHPLHIADTLLRHGLQISCFGLEFNLDYWPHGTLQRDPLQWVDLIDLWSQFGLPLFVMLTAPVSEEEADHQQLNSGDPDATQVVNRVAKRKGMDAQQMAEYLESVLRVLLAKPIVNGIVWGQLSEQPDARFPGNGLISENNERRPIDDMFTKISTSLFESPKQESKELG